MSLCLCVRFKYPTCCSPSLLPALTASLLSSPLAQPIIKWITSSPTGCDMLSFKRGVSFLKNPPCPLQKHLLVVCIWTTYYTVLWVTPYTCIYVHDDGLFVNKGALVLKNVLYQCHIKIHISVSRGTFSILWVNKSCIIDRWFKVVSRMQTDMDKKGTREHTLKNLTLTSSYKSLTQRGMFICKKKKLHFHPFKWSVKHARACLGASLSLSSLLMQFHFLHPENGQTSLADHDL